MNYLSLTPFIALFWICAVQAQPLPSCKQLARSFDHHSPQFKTKSKASPKKTEEIKSINQKITQKQKVISEQIKKENFSLVISNQKTLVFIDSSTSMLSNNAFENARQATGLISEYAPVGTQIAAFTMFDFFERPETKAPLRQILPDTEITASNRGATASTFKHYSIPMDVDNGMADSLLRSVEYGLNHTDAKVLVFVTDGFFDVGEGEGDTTPIQDYETALKMAQERGVELRFILVGGIDPDLYKHLQTTQSSKHIWVKDAKTLLPSSELTQMIESLKKLKEQKKEIIQK